MKKHLVLALFIVLSLTTFAQSECSDSLSIQAVIDACIKLRDAAALGDSMAIKQSADQLRACNTVPFNGLKRSNDSIISLNGHLVFDEVFADSLAEGVDVYHDADELYRVRTTRSMVGKAPKTSSHVIRAGESSSYTFKARGWQEIAVVSEHGGRITTKVHVANEAGLDKNYNDTEDVRTGRPERKRGFSLPNRPPCTVELEIINCGDKDISIVVISN